MNRRPFFTKVSSLVPVVGVSLKETSAIEVICDESERLFNKRYRDYLLGWTGWKASMDRYFLCGQWIAHPEHRKDLPHLWVNFPGGRNGTYSPGDCFNISFLPGRKMLDAGSPIQELNEAMEIGLKEIVGIMDDVIINPKKYPLFTYHEILNDSDFEKYGYVTFR